MSSEHHEGGSGGLLGRQLCLLVSMPSPYTISWTYMHSSHSSVQDGIERQKNLVPTMSLYDGEWK